MAVWFSGNRLVVMPMQKLSFWERGIALSVAEAIALMLSFGSFVATLIFGILDAVNKNNKKK